MFQFVLIFSAVTCFIYYVIVKPHQYWSKRNVKSTKITPIFGNNLKAVLGREPFHQIMTEVYSAFEEVRYVGMYIFQSPMLMLKDPDLIKQICVKDFDHFANRRGFGPDNDELMSKGVFNLKDQKWKDMRSTLGSSFTSSKMKATFILMSHNAKLFVDYYLNENENFLEIEMKDAFTRYANDVIANAVFGLEVDSLKEKTNEFYLMAAEASNLSSARLKLVAFLSMFVPSITSFFKLSMFSQRLQQFFMNIVKDTIEMREKSNFKRPDVIGILMEAKKGKHGEKETTEIKEASFAVAEEHLVNKSNKQLLTNSDIAAQTFFFFIGGFDTISAAMCFMAYELAINPDVQRKLIAEIEQHRPANGSPTYEIIANMTYFDMVVSETFRKWPLGGASDRVVTKPYTIQPTSSNETPLHLNVGDSVVIPMIAIHRDPKYYDNPDKFNPERFSPENRRNIKPYTYIPFGVGPRNCIGSRFAILEVKAMFFYLLSHFEIVPVEKTNIPLKISKTSLAITSENGFPLGLKRLHKCV